MFDKVMRVSSGGKKIQFICKKGGCLRESRTKKGKGVLLIFFIFYLHLKEVTVIVFIKVIGKA